MTQAICQQLNFIFRHVCVIPQHMVFGRTCYTLQIIIRIMDYMCYFRTDLKYYIGITYLDTSMADQIKVYFSWMCYFNIHYSSCRNVTIPVLRYPSVHWEKAGMMTFLNYQECYLCFILMHLTGILNSLQLLSQHLATMIMMSIVPIFVLRK